MKFANSIDCYSNPASDPGFQALKNASLQVKAEKHGLSVRQVIGKIFGVYKAATRAERLGE